MKTYKVFFAMLALVGSILPTVAKADTCAQADNLLTCIHQSAESCRASAGCATDREQALSSQDVIEGAATLCCAKSPKASKRCLKVFSNRLQAASRAAPAAAKPFLNKARREVTELRTNGCDTGSLGDI